MSSAKNVSQVPFILLNQPNVPPRDPKSNPSWIPPWQRPIPHIMLHHLAFQLSRPPPNPHNLPQWALRPRGLDAELLDHLGLGIDKDWQYVVDKMINGATSPPFDQTTATEDDEFEENSYNQLIQDENNEEEDLIEDSHAAGDRYGDGIISLNDEEQSDEDEGDEEISKGFESEDVYQPKGYELEEYGLETVRRKRGRALNPPSSKSLSISGEKRLLETRKKIWPDMTSQTLSPPLPRNEVKRPTKETPRDEVLDKVLLALTDEMGTRRGQRNNRNSRFLKEQERLLAQFLSRDATQPDSKTYISTSTKRRRSDDESFRRSSHPLKRQKTESTTSPGHKNEERTAVSKRSRFINISNSPELAIQYVFEAPPAKRRIAVEENEFRANTEDDNLDDFVYRDEQAEETSPPARKQPMGPSKATARGKEGTSQGGIKKGKWEEDEEQVLIDLMIAQRMWEVANNMPPKTWLKDVKLYEKISRQLADIGIARSSAACKNQWNRSAREKSGFDERPDNGGTRSLICSEQKPRKEKEKSGWK